MNDSAAHPLALTLTIFLLVVARSLFLFVPRGLSLSLLFLSSRSPLLFSSALGSRRVAILALGLFVKPTTELVPSPSRPYTLLCDQPRLSSRFLSVSWCLF